MKNISLVFLTIFSFCFIFSNPSNARVINKPDKVEKAPDISPSAFGTMAGVAYACNAGKKLEDYELIVSRIMMAQAKTKKMQDAYLQEYVIAKKDAMQKQQKKPPMSCDKFLKEFYNQKVFQSTVMSDGSVKNPDGSWLLPAGQKEPPKGY